MKQLIESQPVSKSPFVHVGYLAASSKGKMYGSVFFSALILLIVSFCVYAKFEKQIEKTKWKKVVVFSLIAVFYFYFYSSLFMYKSFPYGRKYGETYNHIETIYHTYELFLDEKEFLQYEEYKPGIYTITDFFKIDMSMHGLDEWGTDLKFKIVKQDKKIEDVYSAGPDKKWDTEDDLSLSQLWEIRKKEREETRKAQGGPFYQRLYYKIKNSFYWGS